MEFGELLKSFLLSLQTLFRTQGLTDGLTLSQVLVLSLIPDDGIDMTTLAKNLGVDNSTATRLVGVMLKRGWVEKKQSSLDRRVMIVRLTPEGEILQEQVEAKIDQFGSRVFSAIAPEDREEVKEILSSFHWTISKLLLKQQ